jgi:hypothetical protein
MPRREWTEDHDRAVFDDVVPRSYSMMFYFVMSVFSLLLLRLLLLILSHILPDSDLRLIHL